MTEHRTPDRELRMWMADGRVSCKQFADRIGCNIVNLSRIRMGLAKPGLDLAFAIERETGGRIKAVQWTSDARVDLSPAEIADLVNEGLKEPPP